MRITIDEKGPNSLKVYDDNGKRLTDITINEIRLFADCDGVHAMLLVEFPSVDIHIPNENVKLRKGD